LSPGDAGRILVADASGRALVVVEEGPAAEINSFVKTAQPLLNSVRF
jgi:hypothetical protein